MKLSDFQIPDAPVPVDPEVMARNAKSSGQRLDWRNTKVKIGERASGMADPLVMVADYYRRDDAASASRRARSIAHDLLERGLDELEKDQDVEYEIVDEAEPKTRTSAHRSFGCDRGGALVVGRWRKQNQNQVV